MSINSALQIGRSGLVTSSLATDVAGNNLANVATRNYHRQAVALAPAGDQQIRHGMFLGRGVEATAIVRVVNEALEARVRNGIADQAASAAQRSTLEQIEALGNELSDNDLSTQLSDFFNAWSDLANQPLDSSLRNLVIQQGKLLASFIANRRTELVDIRIELDKALEDAVSAANDLLDQIETVNQEIVTTEGGTHGAHALRDHRDALLQDFSEFINISIVEQPTGMVDLFAGSLPVVLNGQSRGLEIRKETEGGQVQTDLLISDDRSVLNPESGQIAGLLVARQSDLRDALKTLDMFTNQLIFQVNRAHSQGQGTAGFNQITGTTRVLDSTAVLTDPAAGLPFMPQHGSFEMHVRQKSTGQLLTRLFQVDLDGIGDDDTTLDSLASDISAQPNITAISTLDGRLQITVDAGDFEITFGRDSSGVVAALGLNSFFAGSDATDIQVNAVVEADTNLIAVGQDNVTGDNRNALALAAVHDQKVDAIGSLSLTEVWNSHVEEFAVRLGQSVQRFDADTIVRENLEAQQQQFSGVNSDEEVINLLSFQRTFQASARFLAVVDEMIETLLQLV